MAPLLALLLRELPFLTAVPLVLLVVLVPRLLIYMLVRLLVHQLVVFLLLVRQLVFLLAALVAVVVRLFAFFR